MDDDAARWWAAVLSPAGWQATVFHNGHIYKSPWSVRNIDTRPFILRRNYDQHCPGSTPPSSRQALKYLADFCATHNLSGQCCTALMATLFIPFNSGRTITLPLPVPYTPTAVFTRPSSSKLNIAPLPFSRDNIYEQRELLPYYMTLSCNGWALRSLLHSTFFNPDVYCNLVGSWLEPAFEALEPILDAEDYTGLTILLTRRQPVLGPLWLGAILTGTATTILHAIRSGQWAVDLHAAAWTGTEQSFLTTKLSGPRAAKQSRINRDDECRLLFLTGCDGFSSVPVCPWKPFGSSALSDTEIAVRLHARCRGHDLRYTTWKWDLDNGMELEDSGLKTNSACSKQIVSPSNNTPVVSGKSWRLNLQSVSEVATRSIFGWLRMTGYPPSEKDIRTHPWFDVGDSDEESCDEVSSA
ncbi:hypothetical protein DIZ76_014270 [Coccidioides immitis]|nr:hypothetical protein DIZ76_014270 [Coccidioides immitis]